MDGPSPATVENFAKAFAHRGGLTRKEILAFFQRYSKNVVDPAPEPSPTMTKQKIFAACLQQLHVEDQYRALIDLCFEPPDSRNPLPDEAARLELSNKLHAHSYANGVSVRSAAIDSWPIKLEWLRTAARVEADPAAALTKARTTLERTCIEVLRASGSEIRSRDLGQLVKAARSSLGLQNGADRAAVGVTTIVNAIAEASNSAGDRHATADEAAITVAEARLMCDLSLALSLFLIDHMKVRPAESSDP